MAARTVHPLPMSVGEITPEWLTSALRTRAPGATVLGCEILSTINSTTTVMRLKLELDAAAKLAGIPERVVLKGGFEAHSRRLAEIHRLEVQGYRDVLPVLELPCAACYFADYRADQLQGIVIMEDLWLRKVDFCNALRPQTFDQVAGRLTAMARFHAKTWDSPEFKSGRWSWIEPGLGPLRDMWHQQYMQPEVWSKFVSSPRGAASSVRFHDLQWARDALDRLVRLSHRLPHVIVHGDAHLGNTYIDQDGGHGFYDPMIHRDHAIRDVGYHLAGALDTYDRRRWEGALLQHYLDELAGEGVKPPSFDEMLRIYGAYLALGYVIWFCNDAIFQTEQINTANVARFSAAMIDHDTLGILRTLD